MAFTGTTYAELAFALDEIKGILRQETQNLASSQAAFSAAISRLDALLGTYSGIDTAAAALLATDPSNPELIAAQARLGLLIANRNTLRNRAEAMQDAVSSL